MSKYQEALDRILKYVCVNKGSMFDDDLKILQEAIDKANKYDELTEVKKIKRITPPFGDNVPINKYPKLFICPNCEIQINQFKDYKKFKCCPVCGQRIGV